MQRWHKTTDKHKKAHCRSLDICDRIAKKRLALMNAAQNGQLNNRHRSQTYLDRRFPKWGSRKNIRGGGGRESCTRKKNIIRWSTLARQAKPLTVTDFWPCDLIIYRFYCSWWKYARQWCESSILFFGCLKSVVDKDGGEMLVSS